MSQDVLGYPDTVATAPESHIQVVLSVLGCPRMSWDIVTQWLQPLSPRSKWSYLSWNVPGCPGISRHSGYSPKVPGPSGPICPGMSQDVLGYPDTVATAPKSQVQEVPESQVQVVLSAFPGMSQDVLEYPDTVATAPESHIQVVLSVLGCPRMS